jgi:D-sedoheptulose 7-phosphate isomerase
VESGVSTELTRLVGARIRESLALQRKLLEPDLRALIARAGTLISDSLREGGKLLVFGNGGSAADAQHLAAELVGRYTKERSALAAIALTANSSVMTAVGNDYSYEQVFERQVEALCRPGDVALGISTSGESANVIAGLAAARALGATTMGLTGATGGRMLAACDECIRFPSTDTPRVQEGHALIAHILCEIVENGSVQAD